MNMDPRRLMLWGVLVLSIVFTSYQVMCSGPAAPAGQQTAAAAAPPASPPASPQGDPAGVAAPAAAPVPPLAATGLAAWRAGLGLGAAQRDPFFTAGELAAMGRPLTTDEPLPPPVEALPPRTLKLVLMEGAEGRALIDGQVVQVGDRVGEELVVEILPDSVVLERGGLRRRLQVPGAKPVQITLERTR